jgi:hypothetical protein
VWYICLQHYGKKGEYMAKDKGGKKEKKKPKQPKEKKLKS